MLNVYWVLFLCVPSTLAAPCLTCYGFQPGCTFETNGKCPMADIPVANLAITAKAGVGGALILQNAVSNKYNRVINREGLNSLQALMRHAKQKPKRRRVTPIPEVEYRLEETAVIVVFAVDNML